jgi:hypothetical protein
MVQPPNSPSATISNDIRDTILQWNFHLLFTYYAISNNVWRYRNSTDDIQCNDRKNKDKRTNNGITNTSPVVPMFFREQQIIVQFIESKFDDKYNDRRFLYLNHR